MPRQARATDLAVMEGMLILALIITAFAPRTARSEVEVQHFFSPALGVEKHCFVYLPPSYSSHPNRHYPVAYYLHGATVDESAWVSRVGIDMVMDSLIARGMPEMLLVMPDGDNSWYMNWANSPSYEECVAQTDYFEDPTRYCVRFARYDDYIVKDLVEYVDRTFRTEASSGHRGIAGLSMGGYGALSVSLHHPEVFSAAVSHSGAVSVLYLGPHPYVPPARYATSLDSVRASYSAGDWEAACKNLGTTYESWLAAEPATMVRRLLARRAQVPALYLDVGDRDSKAGVDENRALDAELTELGVAHEFHVWPGGHDWRYWRAHVGEGLTWLAGHIAK